MSVSRAMLSYLHGFHAGNHADVLKHCVLTAILARLTAKDRPIRYIDTHAGAGTYDLDAAEAQRHREHDDGIGKLWEATDAPAAVARLLELVRACNDGPTLRRYPGSPRLARECLRPNDDIYLFELHPTEHRRLERDCAHDRRVTLLRADGLTGAIGLVPPPSKRGLLLVDPSYELRDEHDRVVDAVAKAHARFATGVVAVWYPVIERRVVERFERALRKIATAPVATFELCVAPQSRDRRGLVGSGVVVFNPPWPLEEELATALPWLLARLDSGGGSHRLVPASR